MSRLTNGHLLIATGLLGIAAYEIAARFLPLPFLAHDFVHGLWVGSCLGLELLGLAALGRVRLCRAA